MPVGRKSKAECWMEMSRFRTFLRQKRRFLVLALAGFTAFYFFLPLAVGIVPHWMNRPSPLYGLPWGWCLAFAQVFVTWFCAWVYWRRAKSFDAFIQEFKQRGSR